MRVMIKSEFYNGTFIGQLRVKSVERDFGCDWKEGNLKDIRISWVELTGEVISVINHFGFGEPIYEIIGIVAPRNPEAIDRMLEGWVKEHSVEWVRERVANRCQYGHCDGSQYVVAGTADDPHVEPCLCKPKRT